MYSLIKINFSTSGKKEHFYQIDPEIISIKVFKKKKFIQVSTKF